MMDDPTRRKEPVQGPTPGSAAPRSVYAGILLCSVGVLMQQVLLTRIFSFTIWYHLAYLTISTALLGFGAAGTILAVAPRLLERDPGRFAALASAAAGGTLLLAMALLGPHPISPDDLLDRPGLFFFQLLGYYTVVTVPFLCAGLAVATPLTAWPLQASRLYAADLLGAGLGCLAAVLALQSSDGAGSIALCAGVLLAAGACYAGPRRLAAGLAASAAALALVSPWANHLLHFKPTHTKVLGQSLRNGGRVVFTKWSAVNRVDLVDNDASGGFWTTFGRSSDYKGIPPRALSITYDGHNGSDAFKVEGRQSLSVLEKHILRTPYLLLDEPSVLVIGVGGGIDVLNAVYHGARKVTGAELQPITVGLHQGQLSKWTGGWMNRPEVRLVAAEGRHFVRSSDETWDLIQITAVDTFSAQTTGAYVLAESYLYTVEAVEDYLSHLSDDGMLSIIVGDHLYRDHTIPSPFSTRLALVAREALRRRGSEDPLGHILLTGQGIPNFRAPKEQLVVGAWIQSLLVKKSPFSSEQVQRIRAFDERNGFTVRVTPDGTPGDPDLMHLIRAPEAELDARLREQVFHVGPIEDDRPFFFHVMPWTQIAFDRRIEWANPGSATGQIVLAMMLVQAVLLGGALILLPLVRRGRGNLSGGETGAFLLYFLGLGLGFLLIEISFVQKYVLVLGYPTYSLSVTLFSLLVFASAGAALSRLGWARPRRFLARLLMATVLLVALEVLALRWIREALLAAPFPLRVAVTALLQLPLGIALGMYFPTGLELLRRRESRLVPWAWAVNGVASVAAAVLAVLLGMSIGFSGVALVAAAVYALGTLSLLRALPGEAGAGAS
jgi:hypothetical protein